MSVRLRPQYQVSQLMRDQVARQDAALDPHRLGGLERLEGESRIKSPQGGDDMRGDSR